MSESPVLQAWLLILFFLFMHIDYQSYDFISLSRFKYSLLQIDFIWISF